MISIDLAEELLNLGAKINDPKRAREQLAGAVALHNILQQQKVAYLADEVGMGKTYVALGALALFRHFNPSFRVLIIAPRENIQRKWRKEMLNFVAHNVRFADMRTKAVNGVPVRGMAMCGNLLDLVRECSRDHDRDFFMRLTSFSLPVRGKGPVGDEDANRLRKELALHFPNVSPAAFNLRDKVQFKDNIARAICGILPEFDLVIVDEGHNLKHGFGVGVSSRNRVLGLIFGHPLDKPDATLFPNFRPKAKRVLFLSATPIEETYVQLWNQLDVFGQGKAFEELRADVDERRKKDVVSRFLIRRVSTIQVHTNELTKNQYRREWRNGGVHEFDQPIRVTDPKKRLVVALVQKKVNEILNQERFSASFQIGMLASFESFLQTAKLKSEDDELIVFDDGDQANNDIEKEGVDVSNINKLSRDYRKHFSEELPHPKMDDLVIRLASAWRTGEKALVFVRRTASVTELKRKLDEKYDAWVIAKLHNGLSTAARRRFDVRVDWYRKEREESLRRSQTFDGDAGSGATHDEGGSDSFFCWYFRGDGPKGILSGAAFQQRFIRRGTTVATFFDDNYVSLLLGCVPGECLSRLASLLGKEPELIRLELSKHARAFLTPVKKVTRGDLFEAVQAAAINVLRDFPGPHQALAKVIWYSRFESCHKSPRMTERTPIGDVLEEPTFFTELRRRPALRDQLWARSSASSEDARFKEEELRARLLSTAARLGHAFIDFYLLAAKRYGNLKVRTQDQVEDDSVHERMGLIREYLDMLEQQMQRAPGEHEWCAFDELSEISRHFDLILDVNLPEIKRVTLDEATREFARLLGRQQPVGGMAGQVNRTLVRQFRMPGYPFVLISTDLLQEGEDLHTFCSSIYHYGISWTPSSMEQRVGRVDRVRSLSDRRLGHLERLHRDDELLQVYFPHLEDTVEVLQVRRVLSKMNTFLRLMHEGLTVGHDDERKVDLAKAFAEVNEPVPRILGKLCTAFPIRAEWLKGTRKALAVGCDEADTASQSFRAICDIGLEGMDISWEHSEDPCLLLGTLPLGPRTQPFKLHLRSFDGHLLVRCVSPVGVVSDPNENLEWRVAVPMIRLGALETSDGQTYNLTVEGDVLLTGNDKWDRARLRALIHRVAREADRIEHEHLCGVDQLMSKFKEDLQKEHNHAD